MASHGRLETVKKFLELGVDLDYSGGIFGSALQAAAANGHIAVVRELLVWGSDANVKGGLFGSALMAAKLSGHTDVVHLIEQSQVMGSQLTLSPCGRLKLLAARGENERAVRSGGISTVFS